MLCYKYICLCIRYIHKYIYPIRYVIPGYLYIYIYMLYYTYLMVECMLICICSLYTDITVCLLCLVFKSGNDFEVRSNCVLRVKSRNLMDNNLKTANYDYVLLVLELSLDQQVSTTLLRL